MQEHGKREANYYAAAKCRTHKQNDLALAVPNVASAFHLDVADIAHLIPSFANPTAWGGLGLLCNVLDDPLAHALPALFGGFFPRALVIPEHYFPRHGIGDSEDWAGSSGLVIFI